MRALLRLALVVVLTASFGCLAFAADVQGVLLDRMCSAKIVASKDMKAAADHTRDCALMDPCMKSGYGVLTSDGKFIVLDNAGNEKAVQALKASKKAKDIRVQVSGELAGDAMKVTGIKIL